MTPAGYSGTPLPKKLGIALGSRCVFQGAPTDFANTLGELPDDVQVLARPGKSLDLAVLFVKSKTELEKRFPPLAKAIFPDGMLWIAWPKKSSGVATDLTEEIARQYGLSTGLVDTKICAIDDTWSGLKFVHRVVNRPKPETKRKRG